MGCRLAILNADKAAEDSIHQHISHYKDASVHSSMVDSRKTLPSSQSFSEHSNHLGSRSNSLGRSTSIGTYPSRASEMSTESKRSLQPSTSFGSATGDMMRIRSSQTIAGKSTILHRLSHIGASAKLEHHTNCKC